MVRLLSDSDVARVLSLPDLLRAVERAFVKQGRDEVERPPRPHFPVGEGLDGPEPAGTSLAMPAYIHGAETYATKLVAVHEGNVERGLPTVHAQVAVSDAATGRPLAYLDGTRITGARTGCIGGLAARELSTGPVRLGLVGAGTQARWQARAVAAATDQERVRVFSPSDSRERCAADLRAELDADVAAVDRVEDAVAGANVVVTATTSETPVFPGSALDPGALVVAVGAYTASMRELDRETMERAARVFADVPEEVAEIGDAADNGLSEADLVPFSAVLEGDAGRRNPDEIVVVESVGSAVLDAAAAELVYEAALEADVGTDVSL